LLAVLLFVKVLAPVEVFLSEAQHTVEQHSQLVGHGRGRHGCSQFAAESAGLRAQVAVATPERGTCDTEGLGACGTRPFKRLFSAIDSKRDRSLFLLAYRHGLRASEVGLLHISDIDFKKLRIIDPRSTG